MEKDPAFLEEIKAEFLAESGAIDQRVSMQNTLVAIPNVIGRFSDVWRFCSCRFR